MTASDRGYGDRDDYTATPDAAAASALAHAVRSGPSDAWVRDEVEAEQRQEQREANRRRWGR